MATNSTGTGSGTIEFGQETVSILVIVGVCVFLAIINVFIWLCGCRRHSKQNQEEINDRQLERDRYNDKKSIQGTPFATRKVASKPCLVKKADTVHVENELNSERGHQSERAQKLAEIRANETIEQFENRIRGENARNVQRTPSSPLEDITEEKHPIQLTPVKNKRLEQISSTSASSETLQRNDSKVNVFNTDKLDEVDLNPALNAINLETI